MFRSVVKATRSLQTLVVPQWSSALALGGVRHIHPVEELDEEFDARFINYFNKKDIDGWQIRQAINDLQGHDMVPDPKVTIAALQACRRINDYALCIRHLEAVHFKCMKLNKAIWPYVLQQIEPTMKELGISSIAEMGYDKPELALKKVEDM